MGKHYSMNEAASISIRCAADYKKSLENKNYIFIYQDRATQNIEFFEAVFLPRHFMHLTGLSYTESYRKELGLKEKEQGARNFYRECLSKTIHVKNIQEKTDGTTSLKLEALPQLINFLKMANMTVTYSGNRTYLACDSLDGTVKYALGFKKEDKGFFSPSSCLKEDIRNFGDSPSKILAILTKNISDPVYTTIKYVAKKVPLDKLTLPESLEKKISLIEYRPSKNS